MPRTFVLTLTGPDRIGIVDEVTGLLLDRGGNVETSRMARLGGAFAVLMLVTLPGSQLAALGRDLERLAERGYRVATTPTEPEAPEPRSGWLPAVINVQGADHEGIIHEVAHYLSSLGINIESIESEAQPAPTSGIPLFAMTARLLVPPGLVGTGWEAGLDAIGQRLNLDITVAPEPAQAP